jgi:hypothetical protein
VFEAGAAYSGVPFACFLGEFLSFSQNSAALLSHPPGGKEKEDLEVEAAKKTKQNKSNTTPEWTPVVSAPNRRFFVCRCLNPDTFVKPLSPALRGSG